MSKYTGIIFQRSSNSSFTYVPSNGGYTSQGSSNGYGGSQISYNGISNSPQGGGFVIIGGTVSGLYN